MQGLSESKNEGSSINSDVILWGIAAIVLSIIMVTFNNSSMVLGASFLAKSFSVIVGILLGTIGALIGNALRKFAHPNTVYTTGGFFQLIWIKVFWSMGPQVVGLFLGVSLGISIVLN